MPATQETAVRTDWKQRLIQLRDSTRECSDETEPWTRGIIATEVWLDGTKRPIIEKSAEVVARCLEEIPPALLAEDRFAGLAFRRYRVHSGVSDSDAWRMSAKHPERNGYDPAWPLPPHAQAVYERWEEHGPALIHRTKARTEHAWLAQHRLCSPYGLVDCHTLPDYGILLSEGLDKIRQRLKRSIAKADSSPARMQFSAMLRIIEALQAHCRLCAATALRKADTADTDSLRAAAQQVAGDCARLAENPPETMAQALQLVMLGNCADILGSRGDGQSMGRLDQLLIPYYNADIAARRITRDEALYIIGAFLLKIWGIHSSRNLCIGGLRPDGTDGTNEVSYLFLEAQETLAMGCDVSVRMHKQTPPQFLTQHAHVMRLNLGRGSTYNDDVTVDALVRKGVAIEDARDYSPLGCVEVMIPGRSSYRTMGFNMNLSKVLELVVNRGRCLVCGKQLWNDIPESFDSFARFMEVYRQKIREVVGKGIAIIKDDEHHEVETYPRPWLTVLSRGGLEDGRDFTNGQPKYNPVGVTLMGIADIANSLYALKRLVFEERAVSLETMRTILRDNWEGHETLRQRVINRFERFGQDTAEINAIAQEEAHFFARCFDNFRTWYGDRFWPMIFGVSANMIYGANPKTGATPGGRRHPETLAHSLQPSPEGPRGNLTEILSACTAIDYHLFAGGISNVQEVDPAIVAGNEGLKRLATILRGYMEMGGMEISLNFLSEKQLLDAQKHPEKHPYLMVRLFGLSARFVALSPEVQLSVIERARATVRGSRK